MTPRTTRAFTAALGAVLLCQTPTVGWASPLTDPPAAGKILYYFPGAGTSAQVSTVVHCANLDKKDVDALISFTYFDFNSVQVGSSTSTVPAGRTVTIAAGTTAGGNTAVYSEDSSLTLSSDLNQGTVRVSSEGTTKIICTAQVIERVGNPPTFAVDLPQFRTSGKHQ
jgi:hypothetical protein